MIGNIDLNNSNIGTPFFLEESYPLDWQMTRNERYCLITLLERIRPQIAIEIGTHKGGSLQVLSQFSEKIYSIDVNPNVKKELNGTFDNVDFLIGDSKKILPSLFVRDEIKANIEFILIDGDHSFNGVKGDIDIVLELIPKKPLFIIFHDSFNPECRRGIKAANFHKCEYVHYVELDFINGVFNPNKLYREMWGGLALVILLPKKRDRILNIYESQKKLFALSYLHSIHPLKDSVNSLKKFLKNIF